LKFKKGRRRAGIGLGAALFRLDKSDPHLLPDLSAAIVIPPPETKE
jgi:hypothetical protein